MNRKEMATLTASLERSLRNCSLNHRSLTADDSARRRYQKEHFSSSSSDSATSTLVDLNSHISLPYHWEQCLDLKTGEIYYVDWRSGKKVMEDPRLETKTTSAYNNYSDDGDVDEEHSYDSQGSCSSESSIEAWKGQTNDDDADDDVLVVAGCNGCLMYYMVPKHVNYCPKCTRHLLHFDDDDHDASL